MNALRMSRFVFLFGTAILQSACDRTNYAIENEDIASDGFKVVVNVSPQQWSIPVEIQTELQIGRAEGEGPEVFGEIYGLAVDSIGRIAVLDGLKTHIVVFDSSGVYERQFLQKGEGPGEVERAIGLFGGRDGSLWTIDSNNGRFAVFDFSGDFRGFFPRHATGFVLPWRPVMDAEGRIYDLRLDLLAGDGETPQGQAVRNPGRWDEGISRFTLTRTDLVDGSVTVYPPVDKRYHLLVTGRPAPSYSHFTFTLDARGFIWHTDIGPEYRVFQRSFEGDTLLLFTREVSGRELTDDERDSLVTGYLRGGSRLGSTDLPKTKRAVARISVTDSGLIVVQVNSEGEEQEANFDVFSRDGEWLGSLHWDVPFVSQFAPIFSRCRVYGIVLDEMDVTYLVVGKIEELCDD